MSFEMLRNRTMGQTLRKTKQIYLNLVNIKRTCHYSNERVQCNTEFVDGEVCVDNTQQVVNKFNDCFVNLGPGLAEKIPLQSVQPREYLKGDYLSSMFLEPTLEDEVRIIILNLKKQQSWLGWFKTGYHKTCLSIYNIAGNTHCKLVSRKWHCIRGVKKSKGYPNF